MIREPKTGEPDAAEQNVAEPKTDSPETGEPRTGEPEPGATRAGETETGEPQAVEPTIRAPAQRERRTFLTMATSIAMTGGLVAGYGTFGLMAARYLYPAHPARTAWLFVADLASFKVGASRTYRAPSGASVVIARRGDGETEADFIALSSTCPHLGCQVHWEIANKRFYCPCHNGTFDPTGKGTGGPPGDAGQSLPRYPLRVERGLLYIDVPMERLGERLG
jgi:Rieske Fe-S protein